LTFDLQCYLEETPIINFSHPAIRKIAKQLYDNNAKDVDRVKAAFEFVRDTIPHSFDINAHDVTCNASEVLEAGHGICYAKSHLLAAILRAMGIHAGICYQKQIFDETVSDQMCIHALNAAYIPSVGRWVRFDARGNKEGVNAQFSLQREQLAFPIRKELGEKDYPDIHARPLPSVIAALTESSSCAELKYKLPSDVQ
jgi:transglutaminase-like putative cysteine protease